MAEDSYYVRYRGRVTGPYSLEYLRGLALRKTLSRIHEISQDKASWVAAGTMDRVFQVPPPRRPEASAPGDDAKPVSLSPGAEPGTDGGDRPVDLGRGEPEKPPAATPANEELYYYFRDNTAIGPVGLALVKAAAREGRLGPEDLVWQEHSRYSTPARRIDALSPIFLALSRGAETPSEILGGSDSRSQAGRLSLAGGISAAVLLLFCLSVPHGMDGDRLTWWWNYIARPEAGLFVAASVYLLVMALSLLVIAILVRGWWRGWIYIGTSCLGLTLLIATGARALGPHGPLMSQLSVPLLCSLLVTASFVRSGGAPRAMTRQLQGSCGACACLATPVAAFLTLWWTRPLATSATVPFVLTVAFSSIGFLAALGGGITGAVLWRHSSRVLNRANTALGLIAIAALAVAAVLTAYCLSTVLPAGQDGSRFLFVQGLRFVVAAYSLIVLVAIGLWEVVTESSVTDGVVVAG